MSYHQPSIPSIDANSNTNGFYQPSQQYSFPQGSMAFGNGMQGSGMDFGGSKPSGTPANFTNEQLTPGLFNALSTRGYSFEPSLLEELGINFNRIIAKTKFVLVPLSHKGLSKEIQEDSDLAGPIIFWLMFGILLLTAGKVHFGYIYGVALFGSLSLHTLLKYMSDGAHQLQQQASFCCWTILLRNLVSEKCIDFGLCFPTTLCVGLTWCICEPQQHIWIHSRTIDCSVVNLVLIWTIHCIIGSSQRQNPNSLPTANLLQCICSHGNLRIK